MQNNINLDDIVDYKKEYKTAVKRAVISGNRLTGLCPFHDDKNASFSVDLKTGKYTCFACGVSGNYISFYADKNNIDTKEAYSEILTNYGVVQSNEVTYTVENYSKSKGLPVDRLIKEIGLSSKTEKDGAQYIKIPYWNSDKKEQIFRKRYHASAKVRFKWKYGSAGKLLMYGEWLLPNYNKDSGVIMVEGESDSQTLWFLGFQALGVPGAATYRPEWTDKLSGYKVYLHIEPDRGGETFLNQMTRKLKEGQFTGELYRWSCEQFSVKDPSDLYLKFGAEDAKNKINEALASAKKIDLDNLKEEVTVAIEDAPIHLRQPEGWIYSDKGISQIDEKTFQPRCVCRTPIIITQRLIGSDTGEEKIEIAFKRDDKWRKATFPRSTVFQSKSITALADLGCTITSENSRFIVRFLQALEEENIDILSATESTSSLGWQTQNRFLPGCARDMILDIEPGQQNLANAYTRNGTLEGWISQIKEHRKRYKFRFILAAAFAAPLLRILKHRIFFVYNWGGSRGGKTAALKAALSVWGDPDKLMANFNATQVALERMAGFFCDLPLGIDERQLAGSKQESLEKIVYMLASGTGRARGSKTGGLQTMNTWRSVILATGEQPISETTSQSGINTRIIEVYGGPFDKESEASLMHQQSAINCGWAGVEFVKHILKIGEEKIIKDYEMIFSKIQSSVGDGVNGSHLSGVSAVALADVMIGQLFFSEPQEFSETAALIMSELILKDIKKNELPDVNDSAVQFVNDWLEMNARAFASDNSYVEKFGFIELRVHYIYPTALREALEKAGYSYRKTIKHMAEKNLIKTDGDKNTVVKWDGKATRRYISIDPKDLNDYLSGDNQRTFNPYIDNLNFEEVDLKGDGPF